MSRLRSPFRVRRGFSLVELLMTLSMLVIFFFLAGKLFRSTVLLSAQSQQVSDDSHRIDSALFQLRRDVWNSRTISVSDPHAANLTLSDGKQISWQINSSGDVTRTSAAARTESWPALGPGWSLASDGFFLSLSDAAGDDAVPMRFPSQSLLAGKGRP